MNKRDQILEALAAFIRQRPGLEYGNYGDPTSYRSEMRSITQDRHHAETLLAAVRWRESIGVSELKEAFRANSGRLSIEDRPDGSIRLDYCAGQDFPTEYRKAVCAVLSAALWAYFRENMPNPTYQLGDGVTFKTEKEARDYAEEMHATQNCVLGIEEKYSGMCAGDYLRATGRKEFGRTIANRYFN